MTPPGASTQRLKLALGVLAPPLAEQLYAADIIGFDEKAMEHLQKDADAIARLAVRGYLNDSIKRALHKRIVRSVEDLTTGES